MVDTSRMPQAHAAKDAEIQRAKFAARKIGAFKVSQVTIKNDKVGSAMIDEPDES